MTLVARVYIDACSTCVAATFYLIHATQRLYEGLRVSIHSDFRTVHLLTLLSDLAFPVAAGLTLIAHSPDFHLQAAGQRS